MRAILSKAKPLLWITTGILNAIATSVAAQSQGEKKLAIVFFDKGKISRFIAWKEIESVLWKRISKSFEVKKLKDEQVRVHLDKFSDNPDTLICRNDPGRVLSMLDSLGVTHLLIVSPRTATRKTLNGELRLLIAGGSTCTKPFGGGGEDLSEVISNKALDLLAACKLPAKCGFWKKNWHYAFDVVLLTGSTIWLIAQDDHGRKKLPDPESPP